MAVNQPPPTEDLALNAWLIESTQNTVRLEERVRKLLQDIRDASSLSDLQTKIKDDI